MRSTPNEERFWQKVRGYPALLQSECWPWTATKWKGYGYFWDNERRRQVRAHRWLYEKTVAPVPPGMELDHLCRNRECVNPLHLEVVSTRENTLRGVGPTAAHAKKTHCLRGHPFEGRNLIVRWSGRGRGCRACRVEQDRARRARKRAQRVGSH